MVQNRPNDEVVEQLAGLVLSGKELFCSRSKKSCKEQILLGNVVQKANQIIYSPWGAWHVNFKVRFIYLCIKSWTNPCTHCSQVP